MSQTGRLPLNLSRSNTRLPISLHETLDEPIIPEDSNNIDRSSDSSLEILVNDHEETISVQDFCNSPEFMAEQRLILLEIETSRLQRIAEESSRSSAPPQQLEQRELQTTRNSRRSSIGVKLTCPVCLESFGSVRASYYVKMVTECGHVFCKDCIESVCRAAEGKAEKHRTCKAEKVEASCPVCRKNVGELRNVYF